MKEFKMKKLNHVMLGTILSIVTMNSFAQTDAVSKDPALVSGSNKAKYHSETVDEVRVVRVGGFVEQVGTVSDHPSHQRELKGFARDLPLLTVMKQITPNGWIVKKSDTEDSKVDIQKSVSWEGGKTWIETLSVVAQNYYLNALVNWDDKVITLSNATKTVAKVKKSVFELAATEEKPSKVSDVVVGSSELTAPEVVTVKTVGVITVAPVAPVQKYWDITSSKSLRDNVAAWAEKSGYRLVWTAEDYSVVDARVLGGEFDAENGPIKQLSVDYGPESRAQVPLSFQFYQNRTLVVESMMHEQSGYPQFSKKN